MTEPRLLAFSHPFLGPVSLAFFFFFFEAEVLTLISLLKEKMGVGGLPNTVECSEA